ncbi:MAG: hypothetical protein AB2806_18785 [Candidatus Thiodiazotropha sp.]
MFHDAEQGMGVAPAVGLTRQIQAPDPLQGNRAGRPLLQSCSHHFNFVCMPFQGFRHIGLAYRHLMRGLEAPVEGRRQGPTAFLRHPGLHVDEFPVHPGWFGGVQ